MFDDGSIYKPRAPECILYWFEIKGSKMIDIAARIKERELPENYAYMGYEDFLALIADCDDDQTQEEIRKYTEANK